MKKEGDFVGGFFIRSFKKDCRGLSSVITTMIIVLLILVAIGIIWTVIRNLLEIGEEDIEVQQKCLGIWIKPIGAEYKTGDWCEGRDMNQDGKIDVAGDAKIFSDAYDRCCYHVNDCPKSCDENWDGRADFNKDGKVDYIDFARFSGAVGRTDCVGSFAWSRVTLKRKIGGGDIGGLKIIFTANTYDNKGDLVDSEVGNVIDLGTNIMINDELKTKDYTLEEMGITAPPNKVQVTPYVIVNGKEKICSQTETYEWKNVFQKA